MKVDFMDKLLLRAEAVPVADAEVEPDTAE